MASSDVDLQDAFNRLKTKVQLVELAVLGLNETCGKTDGPGAVLEFLDQITDDFDALRVKLWPEQEVA